jgi:hypothetical protein
MRVAEKLDWKGLRKLFNSLVAILQIYVQNVSQINYVLSCVRVSFPSSLLLYQTHTHTHRLLQHFEVIHHATTTTIHVYEI